MCDHWTHVVCRHRSVRIARFSLRRLCLAEERMYRTKKIYVYIIYICIYAYHLCILSFFFSRGTFNREKFGLAIGTFWSCWPVGAKHDRVERYVVVLFRTMNENEGETQEFLSFVEFSTHDDETMATLANACATKTNVVTVETLITMPRQRWTAAITVTV